MQLLCDVDSDIDEEEIKEALNVEGIISVRLSSFFYGCIENNPNDYDKA